MQYKPEQNPQWVKSVIGLYQQFETNKDDAVKALYSDTTVFIDPVHKIEGVDSVVSYFNHVGKNLNYCEFEFIDVMANEHKAWLKWQMRFSHPRLGRGKDVVVCGASELLRSSKIDSHTDYYDLGAMIYDNVPVLGFVTGKIKQNLKA